MDADLAEANEVHVTFNTLKVPPSHRNKLCIFKLLPLWNLVENDLPRDDDGIHRVRAPISLHSIEDEIWELYRIAVVLVTCFEVTKDVTSQP